MKNWKFIKTGNGKVGNKYEWTTRNGELQYFDYSVPFGGHKKGSVEKTSGGYTGYKMNGSIIISKKEFQTEEEAKKYVENKKVGNENTVYIIAPNGEKVKAIDYDQWHYKCVDTGELVEKRFSKVVGNKKTGNEMVHVVKEYYVVEDERGETSEEFNGYYGAKRLADKWEDEGHETVHVLKVVEWSDGDQRVKVMNESIDKQEWSMFKGLAKDAEKEVGNAGHWNSSKTMYAKWDDATGRPADEYAVITWLGEGKGGLVNIWKGHQMTSEKYGSNDLSDLRRWAEQRIGNEKISYPPEKLKDVSWVTLQYIIIHPEKYDEKTVELAKKIYANRIGNKKTGNQSAQDRFLDDINGIKEKYKQEGKELNLSRLMYELKRIGWAESDFTKLKWPTDIGNKKTGNARPKEQLLADVRELTKYIKDNPDKACEKEKHLLGEAKEELDKNYGIIIGNETLGQWAKAKPRVINETAEEKKFGKVMREFDRGELKSGSGETVTSPEQAKAIAYSESEKVNNLKRARNSMAKNAMGVSDLEAQIKKNEEFIRQQKMRMNGKSKPEQDDIAEGIREAQDEIDRMEMRIAELKEQGNNKKA